VVQIHSPRPIFSSRWPPFEIHENVTVGDFVAERSPLFYNPARGGFFSARSPYFAPSIVKQASKAKNSLSSRNLLDSPKT
jgi:hypothetical protein